MSNIIEQLIDYSRQEHMDTDLNHVCHIQSVVVGVGGIGWWTATFLAMMGCTNIILIDGDKLEPTNLNRLPVPLRMHGEYKVKALKASLKVLRPLIRCTAVPMHLTEDTMQGLIDQIRRNRWNIFDCTDDARAQQMLYNKLKEIGLQDSYYKAGYDAWTIGAYNNMDIWIPDDYRPGYTTTHSNALTSAMAAAMMLMAAGLNVQSDVKIDLKKLITNGGFV